MTRTAWVAGLMLAVAVVAAACAAGRSPMKATSEAPTTSPPPPLGGRPDELRAEIRRLDDEIQRDLAAWDIEAPSESVAASMSATPMADVRATCEHSPTEKCQDVCKLSDSICANAKSICDLADQLPGDQWASERCGAGKASCQRATDRCCTGECSAQP